MVIAQDIFGAVWVEAQAAQSQEIYSSDFFSTILQHYCTKQKQLETEEEFQFNMPLQTPEQRKQITLDRLPVFQIQDTKISCSLQDMKVTVSEIKSVHLPFFDDMLQVEMFVLETLGKVVLT